MNGRKEGSEKVGKGKGKKGKRVELGLPGIKIIQTALGILGG